MVVVIMRNYQNIYLRKVTHINSICSFKTLSKKLNRRSVSTKNWIKSLIVYLITSLIDP